MYGIRICLLAALIVSTTSAEAAEDYVVPAGVSVLTEDQLLNQIIGSTLVAGNGRWYAFFCPQQATRRREGLRESQLVPVPLRGTGRLTGL